MLRGYVAKQAALHGILTRTRDLGVPLLSVEQLDEAWLNQQSCLWRMAARQS